MYNIKIEADSIFDLRQKVTRLNEDLTNDFLGRHGSESEDVSLHSTKTVDEVLKTTDTAMYLNPTNVSLVAPLASLTPSIVERDSKGMPFDLRIHSEKKSKNLDGSWRYKRGVKDDAIALVEAELKGTAQVPAVAAMVLPTIPPLPFPTTEVVNQAPTFVQPPMAQAPVVQAPAVVSPAVHSQIIPEALPQLPGAKPAHTLATFKNHLMDVFAQFINEKKFDQKYVDDLVVYFAKDAKPNEPAIKNIWNILGNERQCITMFEIFVNAGWITRVEG